MRIKIFCGLWLICLLTCCLLGKHLSEKYQLSCNDENMLIVLVILSGTCGLTIPILDAWSLKSQN